MATDEEKCKLAKLLQGLEVPELQLSERCNELVKEFREKYQDELDDEDLGLEMYENPYVPDKQLLEENAKKLKDLLSECKRGKKTINEATYVKTIDLKRPWRSNSSAEKLLRLDIELKQHREKANQAIAPLEEEKMKDLVKECQEETLVTRPVGADRLKETVEEAKKILPNFQYRNVVNSTATAILPNAQTVIASTPARAKAHDP